MRRPSLISLLCGGVLVLVSAVQALHVSLRQMRDEEGGVYTAARMEANGENFSLVVPYGWRAANVQPDSFSLSASSGESPISIVFSTQPSQPVLASITALRAAAVPFLKDAVVVEDFPAYSGYGPGRGLDLSFVLQGHSMKSRVVVIPLAQGFVSFHVASATEKQAASERILAATLTSFRKVAPNAPEPAALAVDGFKSMESERPKAQLAAAVQQVEELHTEPVLPVADAASVPKPRFAGREDFVQLGIAVALLGVLILIAVVRHKQDAEIRILCGGYLSDGTEVASFKMPEWFTPQLAPEAPTSTDVIPSWMEAKAPAPVGKSLVEKFLEQAPELLDRIRQALRALGRSGSEAEWQAALQQLPQHLTALKERANFWEMRPAWQMCSALELLAQRIAEKPKDATPSTIRTLSSAVDLLQNLCAPGIRPNLIIDPPIKVLAVDDDALCLRALTFGLQKANLIPDVATNGVQALALATERPYDVIFMDIQMPEMDGLTACQRIRETEANADTPVVFVTILSDFHTRAQSTIIGGSDLMAKPFLVFELAVKALTTAMRKRLQLQNSNAPGRRVPGAGLGSTASESIRVAIVTGLAKARQPEPVALAPALSATAGASDASPGQGGFLDEARDYLVAMRQVLEELALAPDEAKRQERLGDIYLRVHAFTAQAGMAGLPLAARVGSALEALLKKLYEKPGQTTASTCGTIATALDLLDELRVPGRRQKLTSDSPVHLLVVDDEPLARRSIAGALQLAFDKPDSAEDGTAALALAVTKPYDVIFTDVQMPGLDGFALCTELRATATNRTTPVVFITSQDDGDAREKARQCGGSDFIAKPCMPSEITLKALTFVIRKRLHSPDRDADRPNSSGSPAVAAPPLEELVA